MSQVSTPPSVQDFTYLAEHTCPGGFFPSELEEVEALRAFNDHMAQTVGLQGVIVPPGDGLWVAHAEGPSS